MASDIVRLMKCAIIWLINCFEVSRLQIRQGLLGFSRHLFIKSTENDKAPKESWIKMPTSPTKVQFDYPIQKVSDYFLKNLSWLFKVTLLSCYEQI
jgi:hypothetical protein